MGQREALVGEMVVAAAHIAQERRPGGLNEGGEGGGGEVPARVESDYANTLASEIIDQSESN